MPGIDIADVKLTVLKCAMGIKSLEDKQLYERLELLFVEAYKRGAEWPEHFLDVHAIADQRDHFRVRSQTADELLRTAPIHHYGKDYEQWTRQRDAHLAMVTAPIRQSAECGKDPVSPVTDRQENKAPAVPSPPIGQGGRIGDTDYGT